MMPAASRMFVGLLTLAVVAATLLGAEPERRPAGMRDQAPVAGDAGSGDAFGWSVSLSGDVAVVGAPLSSDRGTMSGAAYVFVRQGRGRNVWRREARLNGSDSRAGHQFGHSVSISRNTIVVGAVGHDAHGQLTGAAYVFERSSGAAAGWMEVARLTADPPAADDYFGGSVAIDGDTILVGAQETDIPRLRSGSVYVFARHAGPRGWGRVATLRPTDGAPGDSFGFSVAVRGDTALIGAPRASVPVDEAEFSTEKGAAYLFAADPGSPPAVWRQIEKLAAADGRPGDVFGWSVGLSGDSMVVGAPGVDNDNGTSGAAYVASRDVRGARGRLERLAHGAGSRCCDDVGASVAITENAAVVATGGAFGKDLSGSAFVFRRVKPGAPMWQQSFWVTSPSRGAEDRFGRSVAADGDTVLFGAPWAGERDMRSGLAFSWRFSGADARRENDPIRVNEFLRPE